MYRVAEQVVLEAFPKQEMLARLNTRLEGGDAHPLEAIITRMLLTKVKLEPEDEDVDEPTPENHEEKNDEDEKPQSITSIIKISLTVLVIGYALAKSRCCLVDDVFFAPCRMQRLRRIRQP